MIDIDVCGKGPIWNPSSCNCECDKSCNIRGYLDYENCECRKKLVQKLIEECAENVEEVKIAGMALFDHGNGSVCSFSWL